MTVTARHAWTDDRLDDFRKHVDQRFDDVDKRFDDVDKRFDDVDKRFDQVDKRFDQVDQRFGEVDKRFDRVEADIRELRGEVKGGFESMQRTMILGFVSISASVVGGLIATQI